MYKDCLDDFFNSHLESAIKEIEKKSKTENEMNEHIEEFKKHINQDMFDEKITNIVENMLNDYLLKVNKKYKSIEKADKKYQKHIKGIWNEGFKLSTCLYDFILEVLSMNCDILNTEHINDIKENGNKIKVLRLLSDRSSQTFKSVLILIKNGMGDDAFKLCRNLHENWVISTFIFQNNEETAKKFLEASDSDINEYNDYEWARSSDLFGTNEKITFNKIFIKCNFENDYSTIWKTQYKKQCKLLHTTPQGVTKSLCLPPKSENEIALVGQSPYGLNIAAEHSAIYLINVIDNYLTVVDNQWNVLIACLLDKILNMIQCEYTKIAQKMGTTD